jgi:hypothetical protein
MDRLIRATSDPAVCGSAVDVSGVMSVGRSSGLNLWNTAPALKAGRAAVKHSSAE